MTTRKKYKILIVDDEPSIRELLEYNLRKAGYQTKCSYSGKDALSCVKSFAPDLILLDIMMPDMDGIEACRQIRTMKGTGNCHIIFLTARSEEYSEIAGFEAGGDDFIIKPIKPRALLSRLSALFRREESLEKESRVISFRDLVIDKESYTVLKNNERVVLTRKEFELLFFLSSHPYTVFNRDDLLRKVWGENIYVVSRTVDVHVRKIREKIGEDYINTIKGIGYKFGGAG
jgi:two-component system alkaline phosphatase synthesis response regulator PhoP